MAFVAGRSQKFEASSPTPQLPLHSQPARPRAADI